MAAAIENIAEMKAPRKVLILGDMFELEEEAEKEHTLLGELLSKNGFNEVYLCGTLIEFALKGFPKGRHFKTRESLIDYLKHNPIQDATILIKASRGIGLEAIADVL
jgi:UDP-N-acetylmuramoyl-tripeptide--D-alanyl-D-alanine ligase